MEAKGYKCDLSKYDLEPKGSPVKNNRADSGQNPGGFIADSGRIPAGNPGKQGGFSAEFG